MSLLRYAAWAVDELTPVDAIRAAQLAKVYCARAGRETAIQVHAGIGNTFSGLSWPREYGGRDLPPVYDVILDENWPGPAPRPGPASATSSAEPAAGTRRARQL